MTAEPTPIAPENPLYDEWCHLVATDMSDASFGWTRYRGEDRGDYTGHRRRHELVVEYAFAVPTPSALARVAALSPIVEVGAGTGYWAQLLAAHGADVLAFDVAPPGDTRNEWRFTNRFYDVQRGDGPDVARAHADRTLLLCWPPLDSTGADTLAAYTDAGGQRVVYVGEGSGGCTGDDAFHRALGDHYDYDDEVPDHVVWLEVANVELPQWPGIHDRLRVYERRP